MLKSKTGAITLYVTIASFFILMAGIAGYVVINNKQADQLKQLNENQNIYSNGISKEDIANSYNGGEIIEIETEEQLLKIGSDENIYLNGKVYNFAKNKTYVLKSDWESNSKFAEIEKAVNEAGGVIIKEYEKQGITTEEVANDTSYIGKYVNYTVPTGGDPNVKWRIFYADGMNGETVAENDRHIYLISEDYLKYDYVPTKTVNGTTYTMTKNSDYKLSFNDMYKAYSSNTCSTNITDTRIKKWMQYVDKYPNSKNENISAVAYMLDTGIWNTKYKNNSFADYAIGGPTIELFNASYKATHPNKYIEATVDSSDGYKVKWSTDSSYSSDQIGSLSTSELNNLYVRDDTNANAIWLASPSDANYDYLLDVYYDGSVYSDTFDYDGPGLRALVCLSSNVQLVPNGDAYELTIK